MKRFVLVMALCLGLSSAVYAASWSAEDLSQYSRQEIEAMGNKDLPLQIAYWEWVKAEADDRYAEWEPLVLPLRAQKQDLENQIADLQRQINELRAEINRLRGAGVSHLIIEGECLWKIASYHYYYGDGTKWPLIYERNRDMIRDPNLIYAGDHIWVPVPLVSRYTVVAGDYLGKIAGYATVYGDRGRWPELYEGNRGQISNPNLIYPGQVLDVPRSSRSGY
ncbi:LysM peptidoglycan-binding domain-containing protein [Candidatus Fermentibacterales bacterium]|nr:LysM peptidoglycan-binding domain-containing protein [Candidatus Fermentibacterales bacterium]